MKQLFITTFSMLLLFACFGSSVSQELCITEFMASNQGSVMDNLGDASDWIEIHNASERAVNLANYSLTDNEKDKRKFIFPKVILQPAGYYVIWASDIKIARAMLPPDVTVEFKSAGMADGNYAVILIDKKEISLNQRGMNLAVLSTDGSIASRAFDTYLAAEESDSLVSYLQSLAPEQIVIFSVRDDAANNLTDKAREVITSFGSKKIDDLRYRDSWGMISIKGKGVVCECYRKMGDGEATSAMPNLHANFKLDREGEYIGIYDTHQKVIDSLTFSTQISDRSFGRISTPYGEWGFLSVPSPGCANDQAQLRYGATAPPAFLPAECVFTDPVKITISSPYPDHQIYYTLDGSLPDSTAIWYDGEPLLIEKPTVIRARCSKDNYFDSDIITQTYIIKPHNTLDIVSLVTSPDNLWDPEFGIYTIGDDSTAPNYSGRGERWERPALYMLIDSNGKNIIRSNCGVRIHGGVSRSIPKKSFRLYFDEPIDFYPKISSAGDSYRQDVIILSGGGNDCVADPRDFGRVWSLIRDSFMMHLYGLLGYPRVNKHPVLLYLNGDYWGIYALGERINQQFLKVHANIEHADLIKDNTTAEEGTLDHWEETVEFFRTADFNIHENYDQACDLVNIENFTDYYILNLFGANWDWPMHNTYCYRDIQTNAKWNWLMWDTDCAFPGIPHYNTLHELLFTEQGNEIFLNLIQHEKYRNFFCNRTCYLLNNQLTPERLCSIIDSLSLMIEPEIENETSRWGGSKSQWLENIKSIKMFALERSEHLRSIINAELKVGGQVYVRILNKEINQGLVKINGNQITNFPFSGIYFANIPIRLQVQAKNDYIFKSWGKNLPSTEFIANLSESDTLDLLLEFEAIETSVEMRQSFEIITHYPNPFNSKMNVKVFSEIDTEIEIEIYNINGQAVTSIREKLNSGYNTITWDANDASGSQVPSGVYLYAISDAKNKIVNKVTLLR